MTVGEINSEIKNGKLKSNFDANKISDTYHTFEELYEHRIILFIAVCRLSIYAPWKSKKHSDGSSFDGWFVLGLRKLKGEQMTYHLPDKYWDELDWVETLDHAPDFDDHTPADVLQRISALTNKL